MPRRSAASIAATAEQSATSAANQASNNDGDNSILSVTTEASTAAKVSRGKADKGDPESIGIDDLLLPRTLTSRLARGILPPNTSIQKDALLALTKAASVFISYLASHANELTQKKTIGPQDVIKALEEIEMSGVMGLGVMGSDGRVGGRLERELEIWESVVRGKRKGYRDKVKARESGAGSTEGGSNEVGNDIDASMLEDEDGERLAKRIRVEEDPSLLATGATITNNISDAFAMPPPNGYPRIVNGHHRSTGDFSDDAIDTLQDDEAEEPYDEDIPDGDDTQVEEDEDEEEEQALGEEEADVDGPDDQSRHDMNGDISSDASD